jgi:mono/diheme cytochrome c family protein
MKTLLKIVLWLVILVVVGAVGVYAWASHRDSTLLSQTIQTHRVDFPIPFPLTDQEVQAVRDERAAAGQPAPTDDDLTTLARAHARARGEHLLQSRYTCQACHGQNFGGGVMVDAFPIGTLLGPNLTTGRGSRTLQYKPSDWDRAVRHGVKPDGTPSVMPADDFQAMSDQELSDIVVYIRSLPPVDADIARPKLGPLGTVLLAFGKIPLAADVIPNHERAHATLPPEPAVDLAFGEHLSHVCSGCHHADFSGGPIPGGDPSWPPSANLTRHADGLAGWTYAQFASTLRTGNRPDGTALKAPMAMMIGYTKQMSDTELQAIWTYLQSLPPVPTPK